MLSYYKLLDIIYNNFSLLVILEKGWKLLQKKKEGRQQHGNW